MKEAATSEIYEAAQDIQPASSNDLAFQTGDKIKVINKDDSSQWFGCNLISKKEGYFEPDKVIPYDMLKQYP